MEWDGEEEKESYVFTIHRGQSPHFTHQGPKATDLHWCVCVCVRGELLPRRKLLLKIAGRSPHPPPTLELKADHRGLLSSRCPHPTPKISEVGYSTIRQRPNTNHQSSFGSALQEIHTATQTTAHCVPGLPGHLLPPHLFRSQS